MADLLGDGKPPNQSEFQKIVREELDLGRKVFFKLLKAGEKKGLWLKKRSPERNKFEYFRIQ
jgi:hypothetical protein